MTDSIVEDAYHRLDGRFVALSEQAVGAHPTTLLHLYRAAAGRLWQAPVDAIGEAEAAGRLASTPAERSLAEAVNRFLAQGPAVLGYASHFRWHTALHALMTSGDTAAARRHLGARLARRQHALDRQLLPTAG